ncbi:MAG TPA: GNAT family N-acetyltransferase [Ktedonobacterales bacterium]|jgi:RimJ/RimL family protein N-acetyltransferase|nr:GNAT family N-acetyltransferase [Ktedonobacterales bacterium]
MSSGEDTGAQQRSGRILNITGTLVGLGPFVRDDLPVYTRWINDFEVTRYYLDTPRPQTLEERAAWYERMSASDLYNIDFLIYELATMRPIGRVGLEDISYQHRRASFGILIGEKDCWGKGYGTEATRLTLDYGFRLLGLHNIMLSVSSANTAAIRAYKRAGFRVIGARRECRFEGDHTLDSIFMDCLSTEFGRESDTSK